MSASRSDYKTILVLDDDPLFHRLIVPVLTSRGHRVLSAHGGREADELLRHNKVDLAIVDGQLPDTTGIDWIKHLRSAGNDATVMFVSAYWRDAQSYHRLTKELGVALVLHKPVLAAVFAAEVDILLGKSVTTDQAELTDFEDTLLALRAEYALELPVRLADLSGLIQQLREQPENPFILGEARTHSHKLRGTAASYGFPEIGDTAAALEDAIILLEKCNDGSARETVFSDILRSLNHAMVLAHAAANDVQANDKASGEKILALSNIAPTAAMVKILVVDDDAAFLDLLEEIARPLQIDVLRASSPAEALDMACMVPVDAALIDVDLGFHETAFKLALQLRSLPEYGELPLAFVSGTGHIERMIEVDSVGHCLYIEKPLKSDAMQSAVTQLLAIKDASRSRVLLIDDDLDFSKRIAFVLSHEGMHVHQLSTTVNILDDMHAFNPDVLLLDVMMPGVSGFDICRMLRTLPRWRDLPIIFLTGYKDVDTRVACLRCGGDDYLSKPVVNEELFTRLRLQLERARLLSGRIDRDNVTGLLLRRSFMDQFATMIGECKRQDWSTSLCLIQVDAPASVQSSMVSDTVLSAVGATLLKRLRAEDLKGRWSENKLILGFRHEEQSMVEQLAAKILGEISAMTFVDSSGQEFTPTLRCGIARMPTDGVSVHELLEFADLRLKEGPAFSANSIVGN